MYSNSEAAEALRRLLQETRRQRPSALVGASSLRTALGIQGEALTVLLAEAVGAGELEPTDIVRCARCRREVEPGTSTDHFVCPECDGEVAVTFRLYAITDKVFDEPKQPKKKVGGRSAILEKTLERIGALKRFFRSHHSMRTT